MGYVLFLQVSRLYLRMMFSCCDRRLAEESQIALILNILCGLSAGEIAGAFIGKTVAFEKRITRAKKVLASSKHLFDVTKEKDFAARLPIVQRALYLLFNEGYHGASAKESVRAELCREALRLTEMLLEHKFGSTPETFALAALMNLHLARIPSRTNAAGDLISFENQNRALWDQDLIEQGACLLELAATGKRLTIYHIEAMIAFYHAQSPTTEDTNWQKIIELYDLLMQVAPSPVVALNRAVAVAQHEGALRGLEEISLIENRERLQKYPFYSAALGELELRLENKPAAREHFGEALKHARNDAERQFLSERIEFCQDFKTARGKF